MSPTPSTRSRNIAGVLSVTALTVALATGCGAAATSGSAKLNPATTVHTTLLSFLPATLTVKAGTTVTWTDTDSIAHTVTTGTFVLGSDGLRTSQNPNGLINMPLSQGKNVTFTFTKPGKYIYYCSIHHGMNGEIVVTP
jgi:plastocyanin